MYVIIEVTRKTNWLGSVKLKYSYSFFVFMYLA